MVYSIKMPIQLSVTRVTKFNMCTNVAHLKETLAIPCTMTLSVNLKKKHSSVCDQVGTKGRVGHCEFA